MKRTRALVALGALVAFITPSAASADPPSPTPVATELVSGLDGGAGSTIGPDGALYVTEREAGRISRVDPHSGTVTEFASGLPPAVIGLGGAMDVEFIGATAYALVTLVGPDVGGSDVVGIYRVDGPHTFTVVADIGAFSVANPPTTPFVGPSGLQYAFEAYRGGFLVTDGHHNRVLRVTRDGVVSEVAAFGDIVPTGLAVSGTTIYLAEAGPVPHLPADGKVTAIRPGSSEVTEVASGAPLLVDVERGRGRDMFALAQGDFPPGGEPGSPAAPGTGSLVKVDAAAGTLVPVVNGLDRPTSLEIVGTTAYVVTLTGEIWTVDNISGPPYGTAH